MTPIRAPKPIVLVPACNRLLGYHPFHIAGRKYIDAVRLAGGLPLVVPEAQPDELDALLAMADGVLLTGSPSNVHPSHFGEAVHDETLPLDPTRDNWTLKLIPNALGQGVPLLAICRGFQETNVALGGTLHQAVQEVPGHMDHRSPAGVDKDAPPEQGYAPAHPVRLAPGGLLQQILKVSEVMVNTVHGQGVKRMAEGLRVEAMAPDGLVEAYTLPSAPGFNLGVQWHPEWQAARNPDSVKLFIAFGDACRARWAARQSAAANAAAAVETL
jgi:putative glutamine amidotransferase